ncbi:type II secretion system F family protein [Marinicella gelatinilytica]|uniref:type II secretion system F family protein n=1 Tax=Marinicella gelatinilytica TaxID=2996017 RepID=UPI002260B0B0|nr:type II secretion system F family protein [Marinicella gelatinilytica]MCX7544678.1 type II secretion system F family protein [Marinicella gelatinilytica]
MAKVRKLDELQTFEWKGVNKTGKTLKGEQKAKSSTLAKNELRRQGIQVKKIYKKRKSLFSSGKSIKAQDIALFSRQLATMMESGVPMVQAFEIIEGGQSNPRMAKLVGEVKTEIQSGSSLSESLGKHPVYFDELYCNLVAAGEKAGVLDELLDTIATYKERTEEIKGKIKKAMFYPAAVLFVAIGVTILLLVKVVPQFQDMFTSFGADLPGLTLMVVNASHYMQANWWKFLLVVGGVIFGFIYFKKRSLKFAHALDRLALKIPIVGGILYDAAVARFSRTLSTTFAAGVPLVEGLQTVSGAVGNVVFRDAVLEIKEDVSTGHQLQLAMSQTNVFPHMVIQMASIGEESGNLDAMLAKVADYYEQEVSNAVDALSSLLEPIIMVLVGGLVGVMVVAMYLPIFKMASVF